MIDRVTIGNFKSFEQAELPLAPLTLLIGANASGKSNAIEALQLLSWIASGRRLGDLLFAIREHELSIRGTFDNFTYRGKEITLGCEVAAVQKKAAAAPALSFSTTLEVGADGLRIIAEQLSSRDAATSSPFYKVIAPANSLSDELQVAYNNFAKGGKKPQIACVDQQAVFTQLATPARFAAVHRKSQQQIPAAASRLRQSLEDILFLDPNPREMRGYSFLQERKLKGDGSALSAVLHQLVQTDRLKKEVLRFIRDLPEQDIGDISFLETPRGEVMLQLRETFGGQTTPREAAVLSDGTLRVLAVAAALLSVSEGSMVVIEEIDNGVHPSRAERLLSNIQRVATSRNLRVLLTTHNPALLDAIPPEAVPDTVACYRDPEQGDSRLVRLEDLESYPELVAQGPIGRLVTKGILDRFLKEQDKRDATTKAAKNLEWLSDFRRRAHSRTRA
jgi:predicted ATPase